MRRPHEWLTVTLPHYFSAWLLHAYHRPFQFLLGLVVLPLFIVVFATHEINVALGRQQALHNLQITAQLGAQLVHETLDRTVLFEEMVASVPGFAEAVRARDLGKIAQVLGWSFASVPSGSTMVSVISPDGMIIACYPADADRVGRDVTGEDAFQGARSAGQHPYISGVYLREVSWSEKVIGIALPLVEEDRVVGFLHVQYRADAVRSWFQRTRVDPSGFLYVVDRQQRLVTYPFQVLPGRPKVVSDWPTVAEPLTPEGRQMVYRDPTTGERWLAGIHPVGEVGATADTGWRVVAVQPERAIYHIMNRVFWPMGALVVILVILVMAVSLRWVQLQAFSMRLLRQNAKLLKQMQQQRTLERGTFPDKKGQGGA